LGQARADQPSKASRPASKTAPPPPAPGGARPPTSSAPRSAPA